LLLFGQIAICEIQQVEMSSISVDLMLILQHAGVRIMWLYLVYLVACIVTCEILGVTQVEELKEA
jgi:hypothetical protein